MLKVALTGGIATGKSYVLAKLQGRGVATIDADSRQQTLTHYVRNRRTWAKERSLALPTPKHFHLPSAWGDSLKENHRAEFDVHVVCCVSMSEMSRFFSLTLAR